LAAAGEDPRGKVLTGALLPPGWLGKPHACAQLADVASSDVLVFVDADVEMAPDGIAAMVALLDQAALDLSAPIRASGAETLGERLVQWS
jgi:hypothetical protein